MKIKLSALSVEDDELEREIIDWTKVYFDSNLPVYGNCFPPENIGYPGKLEGIWDAWPDTPAKHLKTLRLHEQYQSYLDANEYLHTKVDRHMQTLCQLSLLRLYS